MFDFVQRIDQRLAAIERVLAMVLTGAIALIMMVQVILRYFFSAPLFWAEEVSVQLLVFATLFGLSLLVQRDQLVTIDFLPRALPDRFRHGLLAVLGCVMLVLLSYVAWLGWTWVIRPEVQVELGATTQLPRWYNYSVLPLAMVTMSWHQLASILRHLGIVVRGTLA